MEERRSHEGLLLGSENIIFNHMTAAGYVAQN